MSSTEALHDVDDCKKKDWTQKQLQEIISHQISLFGVIQLFESIKKKKIQFSIRMLSSFREKPRKNEWSDTFFEAYKWF